MTFKESGENITVKCSCNNGNAGIVAMYLFHQKEDNKEDNEVVFCTRNGSPKTRPKYENRAQIHGSFMNWTITITNLTVDDSGFFRCAYKNGVLAHFCQMTYAVFVKGVFLFYSQKLFRVFTFFLSNS